MSAPIPALLTDEIKSQIGRAAPTVYAEVTRRDIQKYSAATGQTRQKYLDGDEAPPLIHMIYLLDVLPADQLREDGLVEDTLIPELPLKRIMAGNSEIVYHRTIRPGDKLAMTRRLKDLYEKQGKSGPLIFIVLEVTVETEAGEAVLAETTSLIAR